MRQNDKKFLKFLKNFFVAIPLVLSSDNNNLPNGMIFQKKCQFLRFSVKKGPTWEKGVVQKKLLKVVKLCSVSGVTRWIQALLLMPPLVFSREGCFGGHGEP